MTGAVGRVMVFSASGEVPTDLSDAIDGRLTKHLVREPQQWQRTDYYITRATLSAPIERAAGLMRSTPVVWPEGRNFLIERIDDRCFAGADIWLYLPGRAGDRL